MLLLLWSQPGSGLPDDHVASPMSRYPAYRDSREAWGHRVISSVVVQVESSDGHHGVAVTAGGELAASIKTFF